MSPSIMWKETFPFIRNYNYGIRIETTTVSISSKLFLVLSDTVKSETSIKRTPSGPSQVSSWLIEVGKIAQCLLTINIQRLLCTVIKFHVVKEAKEAVLYFVQDFQSNLQFIDS